MSTTDALEMLDTARFAITPEEVADLRAHIKALSDLVIEAMDDPPRNTPLDGKDWAERATEIVA